MVLFPAPHPSDRRKAVLTGAYAYVQIYLAIGINLKILVQPIFPFTYNYCCHTIAYYIHGSPAHIQDRVNTQ